MKTTAAVRERVASLRAAHERDRGVLEPHRRHLRDISFEMLGPHYMAERKRPPRPFPYLSMVAMTVRRLLAARRPRGLVVAKTRAARPEAARLELALNEYLDDINMDSVLKTWVLSAELSWGIAWVGLTPTGMVYEGESEPIQETRVFCRNVSMDNLVIDTGAACVEDASYYGHRYDLSEDYALDDDDFDHDAVVAAADASASALVHDEDGEERLATFSTGTSPLGAPLTRRIPVWEYWVRDENELWTLPVHDATGETLLRRRPYTGPPGGPGHFLGFFQVPDNLLPLAPGHHWLDLHRAENLLLNKMLRQAARQKEVDWYTPTSAEDAERRKRAGDGEMVKIRDPQGIGSLKSGGIDGMTNAFFLQLRDLASWVWGNVEGLAGLGPQSGTLGQDQLLSASASKQIAEMQAETIKGTRALMRAVVHYILDDPMFSRSGTRRVPGTTIEIPWEVSRDSLRHKWTANDFDIEPYSMQDMSPGETVQAMNTILSGILIPILPLMQQQGMTLDSRRVLESFGRYMPQLSNEFEGWIKDAGAPGESAGGAAESPRKSPTSHRVYTRQGRPGMTRQGLDRSAIAQAMAGRGGSGGNVTAAG